MTAHDMKHLDYIRAVAEEDLRYVNEKDRSYGGSWKRSGGRSAWFMLRRKIDRLLEFMKLPETPASFNLQNVDDTLLELTRVEADPRAGHWVVNLPGTPEATHGLFKYLRDCYLSENIFAKIRENPDGSDGTVLAEIRDLRRYLMLVEAEMMARGVVAVPKAAQADVIERQAAHGFTSAADNLRAAAQDDKRETFAEGEEVQFTSDLGHVVIGRIRRFIKGPGDQTDVILMADGGRRRVPLDALRKYSERRVPRYEFSEPVTVQIVQGPPVRDFTHDEHGPATPDDGGQHASLVPWQVTMEPPSTYHWFYRQAAPGFWRLDSFVKSYNLPRHLAPCYLLADASEDMWCLRLDRLPPDLQDSYAKLKRELNHKEFDECRQKYMYEVSEEDHKYKLKPSLSFWGRDD